MGRLGLPSVTKMEDVLDLITDPDKYKRYITEFMSIYKETQLALGNLQTKEDAESFLVSAADAKDKAIRDKATAEAVLVDARAVAEETLQFAQKQKDEAASELEAAHKSVSLAHKELEQKQALFAQYEDSKTKELKELAIKLDAKEHSLSKLGDILSKKEAKLKLALE